MNLSFRAKIWKSGNSHVVTIPDIYIKNMINPEKTYKFIIKIDEKTQNLVKKHEFSAKKSKIL